MTKNIKINEKFLKLKKKFKVSKLVLGTVAIFSSAVMIFTGCSSVKKNNKTFGQNSNNSTNNYSYSASYDNPLVNLDKYEYSQDAVKTADFSYNEFINYLNNIETVYTYEDIYKIEEALNRYESIKNYQKIQHNNSLKSITLDELLSIVKSNNKKYLEIKKKQYVADFYEEFKDGDLRKICSIIVGTVNHYISQGKISDIDEVKCILSNLKIFKKTTLTNAYVTDDNALMISPSMINTMKIKATKSDQDVFKDTIAHETIHMLQKSCDHSPVYRVGNSFKFEDLDINALFWNWFYEGSAEKLSSNYTGDTPLIYDYYIKYINSLVYSQMLYDNIRIGQLEETTLSKNLDSIYSYFGAYNEKEKREVVKMMFSLDIIEMDTEEFLNHLNLDKNSDDYIKIKRNLKTSVCETLSKYFYKSLAETIKNKSLKLNDIFFMITIFESDLDSHLNYTNQEKYEDNKEFMKRYLDIQNNFFYYLSSDIKYTQEEIENIFNSYGISNINRQNNYNLSFLSDDKKKFVENMLNNFKSTRTEQVRDSYLKNESNVK